MERSKRNDVASDHVLLSNAKDYVIQRLRRRRVRPALIPAWRQFYRQYNPLLRRFAASCGVAPDDLEDTVQTAWAAILEGLPSFECHPRRGSFRAWLFVRVRNIAVDQMRGTAMRREFASGDELERMPSDAPGPRETFEAQWNELVLQEALRKLENCVFEKDYRFFVMRKFHELSVAELAEDSGLSENVVRQRVHRASETFRQLLRNSGFLDLMFTPPPRMSRLPLV
ncbi:MAG: RNA polymerase sigma factor [Pirellulaceae bacterium]